jgi:hypothetical protein
LNGVGVTCEPIGKLKSKQGELEGEKRASTGKDVQEEAAGFRAEGGLGSKDSKNTALKVARSKQGPR